jgi:hypothetical protein
VDANINLIRQILCEKLQGLLAVALGTNVKPGDNSNPFLLLLLLYNIISSVLDAFARLVYLGYPSNPLEVDVDGEVDRQSSNRRH